MKILVLANNDVGLYRFRKELLQRLIEDDHTVYASLPDGNLIKDIKALGCEILLTDVDRRGINPFKDFLLFLKYCKYLKTYKPDVVLTYTIKPNIYGGLACRFFGVKYITNVTGLGTAIENKGLLTNVLFFLYKVALKNAVQVFFQNAANKKLFNAKKIVKEGRLIPGSGVNLVENCYEEYPSKNQGIKFLFVGRIMKAKGIEELLECAQYIKRKYSDVQFSLVGGFDEEFYRNSVEELEKKNILTAYGERNDVHELMKSHHALILPTYHEGLSNVLLEAAASGRPVLTTNVPGCKETFEEGVSGFGCKAKDAQDLIRIVEKFIKIPYEEKIQMGIKGREKVSKEFDRNIIIDAYVEEIEKFQGDKI